MNLKPCPFCGGKAHPAGALDWDDLGREYVLCDRCDASGPHRDTKETATRAWNKRKIERRRKGSHE